MKTIDTYITEKFRLRDDTVIREGYLRQLMNDDTDVKTVYKKGDPIIIFESRDDEIFLRIGTVTNMKPDFLLLRLHDDDCKYVHEIGYTDCKHDNYAYNVNNENVMKQVFIPTRDASSLLDIINPNDFISLSRLVHGELSGKTKQEITDYVFNPTYNDSAKIFTKDRNGNEKILSDTTMSKYIDFLNE